MNDVRDNYSRPRIGAHRSNYSGATTINSKYCNADDEPVVK